MCISLWLEFIANAIFFYFFKLKLREKFKAQKTPIIYSDSPTFSILLPLLYHSPTLTHIMYFSEAFGSKFTYHAFPLKSSMWLFLRVRIFLHKQQSSQTQENLRLIKYFCHIPILSIVPILKMPFSPSSTELNPDHRLHLAVSSDSFCLEQFQSLSSFQDINGFWRRPVIL